MEMLNIAQCLCVEHLTNVCDMIDLFLENETMKKTNYIDISITYLNFSFFDLHLFLIKICDRNINIICLFHGFDFEEKVNHITNAMESCISKYDNYVFKTFCKVAFSKLKLCSRIEIGWYDAFPNISAAACN